MITVKQILKHIDDPFLNLYKGDGYWYFVYDNGSDIFQDHCVCTYRLNDAGIDYWINIGRDFVQDVKDKYDVLY